MPEYHSAFEPGDIIRVKNETYLLNFQKTWKYHHNISDEQIKYANRKDKVKKVYYYHGGDPLYELVNAPGVWHEQLIEDYIPEDRKFVPAINYYEIKPYKRKVIVIDKNGKRFKISPEFGDAENAAKDMEEIARIRSKDGFEKRYKMKSLWWALKEILGKGDGSIF